MLLRTARLAQQIRSPARTCMSLKRSAASAMVKIGTHDGTFHCDEALGCFMLRRTAVCALALWRTHAPVRSPAALQAFKDAQVVRSRVPEVLSELDAVIDVGGVYDPGTSCRRLALPSASHALSRLPATHRYDHHQKEFSDVFGHGHVTRLSSAGLVYKHFGRELVATELGKPESDPVVDTVYLKLYKAFMEAVDGVDNGVNQYESSAPPRYQSRTDLSSRVGKLNPKWNEDATPAYSNAQFAKAMELAGGEFLEALQYYGTTWLPGREPVAQALASRFNVHPSGLIIQLPCYAPWKEHLYELEAEQGLDPKPLFCLYEDEKKNWRVQAISVAPGSFDNRKSLPKPWLGLRDAQLSEASGVEGCIFVHVGGFIGGNATLAGAQAMAIKALSLD